MKLGHHLITSTSLRGSLQAGARARQTAEGEVSSLRTQLQGKTEALEEALRELDRLSADVSTASRDHHRSTKIEKLSAEVGEPIKPIRTHLEIIRDLFLSVPPYLIYNIFEKLMIHIDIC